MSVRAPPAWSAPPIVSLGAFSSSTTRADGAGCGRFRRRPRSARSGVFIWLLMRSICVSLACACLALSFLA